MRKYKVLYLLLCDKKERNSKQMSTQLDSWQIEQSLVDLFARLYVVSPKIYLRALSVTHRIKIEFQQNQSNIPFYWKWILKYILLKMILYQTQNFKRNPNLKSSCSKGNHSSTFHICHGHSHFLTLIDASSFCFNQNRI